MAQHELKSILAFGFFLAPLLIFLYSPSLNGPFVYDSANIEEGSLLHITSLSQLERILFAEGVPRRVGLASFALNFYLGGLRPFGYHLVNVLIHVANAVLLSWILLRILALSSPEVEKHRVWGVAFLAVALWAVHPVQTQAVSYVYQRFTSLCSLFFLLSLCCYLEARRRHGAAAAGLAALSLVSGLAAAATKELAGMLPLFVLLFERLLAPKGSRWDRPRMTIVAFCILGFLLACLVYLGPSFPQMIENDFERRGFTLKERLFTESRVVAHYLSLVLWPHPSRLTVDYDVSLSKSLFQPPTTLVSLGLISSLLVMAAFSVRRRPLLALAIFWFFGNLAVESTFIPLDLAYEHRLYLPSMMFFLFPAHELLRASRPRLVRQLCCVVFSILLLRWSYWTYERNRLWGDAVLLWEDTARKSPRKARVHANLGKAYLDREEPEKARAAFERAIELDPGMVGARVSVANLHINFTGDFREAKRILEEVVEDEPGYAPAHVGLGVLHLRERNLPQAIQGFERALEIDPTHPPAIYNLAAARFNGKEYSKAIEVLEAGVYYWPASAGLHGLLGACYWESGRRDLAEASLRTALSLDPNDALARRYREKMQDW